jgi:hypothetical protein
MDLIQSDFPEITVIGCIGDGSCFFHAILNAVDENYKEMKTKEKMAQAKEFRSYLARNLELKVDKFTVYDKLSRGNLKDFGKSVPEFSLEGMKKELMSKNWVDNKYNELISNTLNVDIYIVDAKTGDLYVTGDDVDILYFNRPSIVILYSPQHYDLIGYKENEKIITIFNSKHKFITTLQRRLKILLLQRIKSNT